MKALDLFCGGGGACIGMQQAGFEVTGVDINNHPNYPGQFVQADVFDMPLSIYDFDFIWASPPCQAFSIGTWSLSKKLARHPNLVPATQELLVGHPYSCIENVPRAPIRADLILTGPTVGLDSIQRKRHFELSFHIIQPEIVNIDKGKWARGEAYTITTSLGAQSHFYPRKARGLPGCLSLDEAKDVMGIPLEFVMNRNEIGEAVAPPYAKFIADEAVEWL